MEQMQKQKQTSKRQEQAIDDMPEVIDETALNVSTELLLGKIALVLA